MSNQSDLSKQIAKHFREVHVGKNWTSVNLKETLEGLTWQQAVTQVHSFNTVAMLIYHMNYYVDIAIKVLQGNPLEGHDKFSFNLPPIESGDDWEKLLNKTWADVEKLSELIENLPESRLWEDFYDKKYGNYYRNIHGIIEHCHYHLGQIVLIKKMVQQIS